MCISVLIPIYNTKIEYFKECLNSIQNQTFQKQIEVIVVNDGSSIKITKQIVKLTEKLNNIRKNIIYKLFHLNKNYGIQYALNFGLKKCSYELIARMDADDIMKPKRLELQYNYMMKNLKVVILGGQCEIMNEKSKKITYTTNHPKKITKNDIKTNKNKHWFINHPTVMYKKSVILGVGGYNNNLYKHAEDMDLWFKLIKKGYDLYNLEDIILTYRDCPNSLSHTFKYDIHKDINKWIDNL